ncbi:ferredoxin reductase family protein [Lentzea sp. NBRC 102530]|uniref:ferredoxin reductase family protein n=1 Tax=Lentzea sp. NBRC 102530 TaxID=3032201 RepID=UPI00249FD883|nr:ferredoxin reductase family protein [Lentzea sp. NBRC 102530]GLY52135.1 oxidoreductase [Lentzea sp. NBRC 102530]
MTTTLQHTARQAPAGRATPHKVLAKAGLYVFLLANAAFVTYLFNAAGVGSNKLINFGRLAGLYGALAMAFQLLLVARLPWLDRRLGMDKLTGWHRWVGFSIFWLLIGHLVFIAFGNAGDEGPIAEVVRQATELEGILRALVAWAIIMTVGIVSARFARRKLAYETWHFIHLYTYVAIFLAFSHQVAVGSTFRKSALATGYWWGLWAFALGSVLVGRVLLPLYRNWKHQFRVAAVVPEAHNVVSVYIEGKDLDQLGARAGQFFLWRFVTKDRWWQANPFSLSAAPNGKYLRLTAKALGTGSADIRNVKVGTRVFAEGPYGAFTTMHQTKPNALLVAGGVGVTPVRALLEEIRGHVVVLYRVSDPREAVLLRELEGLARAKGAVLRLVTGSSKTITANGPLLGPENIVALVPDVQDRDVFICGPGGMTGAVIKSLDELGVPANQIHAERFALAN